MLSQQECQRLGNGSDACSTTANSSHLHRSYRVQRWGKQATFCSSILLRLWLLHVSVWKSGFKNDLFFRTTSPADSNRSSGKRLINSGGAIVENGKRRQSLPHENSVPNLSATNASRLSQQPAVAQQNGNGKQLASTQRDDIVSRCFECMNWVCVFSKENRKKKGGKMNGDRRPKRPRRCQVNCGDF